MNPNESPGCDLVLSCEAIAKRRTDPVDGYFTHGIGKVIALADGAKPVDPLADENRELRRLLADVYASMLASGWREDDLCRRVRAVVNPQPAQGRAL